MAVEPTQQSVNFSAYACERISLLSQQIGFSNGWVMDYGNAVRSVQQLVESDVKTPVVNFVTPILSACLAAAKIASSFDCERIYFTNEATGYAENNGLRHHLGLTPSPPSAGAAAGRSYCQIARLRHPWEVDSCNANIGQLLCKQLENCPNSSLVSATCGVVGELHDNVASHAAGCGFSAAQVYKGKRKIIQIGIADCGCGLGGSVRQSGREMNDFEAIDWCLVRGNTTAGSSQAFSDVFGPQRLPQDSSQSPYPPGVATLTKDNHHMGEGLHRLTELVRTTGGSTWIWSGSAQILCTGESRRPIPSDVHWIGTAIEVEIPVRAFEQSPPAVDNRQFEALARKLNL